MIFKRSYIGLIGFLVMTAVLLIGSKEFNSTNLVNALLWASLAGVAASGVELGLALVLPMLGVKVEDDGNNLGCETTIRVQFGRAVHDRAKGEDSNQSPDGRGHDNP